MRLAVREWGDGPRVVCLHGVGDTGALFERLARDVLDGYRVVAPDLRGHGDSGREPPWDPDTHLADVLETLDHGPPAAWIGHSFGGRLVIELAAGRPELVRRAVLLDPAIRIRPENALRLAEEERGRTEPTYAQVAAIAMLGALAGPHAPVERMRVPTLLVVPRDEPVVGPRQVEYFRAAARDLLQVWTAPCGHATLVEAFEETSTAIADFLKEA